MSTRIALIGLGELSAGLYLRHLRRMPEVRLNGLVETQDSLLATHRPWLTGVAIFPDLRTLFRQAAVDGVVICDACTRRREAVVDCARAGKSILCEIPVSSQLVAAREMWAISQAHDVLFGVCLPIRFSTAHQESRQAIREGKLGEILKVRVTEAGRALKPVTRESAGSASRARIRRHAILIDSLRWLLSAEFTLVGAGQPKTVSQSGPGSLRMEMSNGVVVTVRDGLSPPPESFLWPGSWLLDISGRRQTLAVKLGLETNGVPSELELRDPSTIPTYRMLDNFVQAIRGQARIAATGNDGIRVIEVLEACRHAWEHQTVVAL